MKPNRHGADPKRAKPSYHMSCLTFHSLQSTHFRVVLKISFAFLFVICASLCLATTKSNHILVLHSYHLGYEWTDSLHQGIMDTLGAIETEIDVFVEYMDAMRYPGPENTKSLEGLYAYRYKQRFAPDLIICSDDPALDFLLDNRQTLFPDTPILFCGINDFTPDKISGHNEITGVNERISLFDTLEIALTMSDQAKRIVVISDSRITGRRNLEILKSVQPFFEDGVDFLHLNELEPEALVDELRQLDSQKDIILYLSYLHTPSGISYSVEESLDLIRGATSSIIYGLWDFLLSYGIVGGKVVHGYSQGQTVALMAMDLLNGRSISSIPVQMESPNQYIFNGYVLDRYEISEALLPEGSRIINRTPKSLLADWDLLTQDAFLGYELFDHHASIMILVDPLTQTIVDANQTAFRYYGYPKLIGKRIQEIDPLPEDDLLLAMRMASTDRQHFFESQHRLHNGDLRDVEIYTHPIQIGDTDLIFTIVFDVTERHAAMRMLFVRNSWIIGLTSTGLFVSFMLIISLLKNIRSRQRSENVLKMSEERYRALFETAQDAIFVANLQDGTIVDANPYACALIGRSYEEIVGMPQVDLHPPEKRDYYKNAFAQASMHNTNPLTEGEVYHRDGRTISVEIATSKILSLQVTDYIVGFFRDVTHRIEIEKALKDERDLSQLYLNTVDMLIVSLDTNGTITMMNQYGLDVLGYHEDQVIGQDWFSFALPQPQGEEEKRILFESLIERKNDPLPYFENDISNANGQRKTFAWRVNPLRDLASGKIVNLLCAGMDISELKKLQSTLLEANTQLAENNLQLEKTNQELVAANYAKTAFLAKVSHELRTPMNGIMVSGQLAEDSQSLEEIKEYVRIMNISAERLLPIVDDLLDLEKIERGKMSLVKVRFDLNAVINDVLSLTRVKSASKQLEFHVQRDNIHSRWAYGDKSRIRQLLLILLDNAVKYTDTGMVQFKMCTKPVDRKGQQFDIEIQDTGTGIKKAFYPYVFLPFEQSEPYMTRKYGGAGLGLSIAKAIIDAMGGAISFSSEEGVGTTFFFSFILDSAVESNSARANSIQSSFKNHARILVAEDDPLGIVLIHKVLGHSGVEFDLAKNGREAVDWFEPKKYDLIFMDVQMPIMDGITAAKLIRDIEKNSSTRVTIIAMTGHVSDDDRQRCVDAGMDGFISKPFDIHRFKELIREYLSGSDG